MEAKINIAKILKNKPEGTKLWTDMFGKVTLYVVTDKCDAFQVKHHNKEPWFDKDGKLCKEGVLCIYPSKSMRNWEKFAWKKCDMLVSNDEKREVLFKTWANDSYTKFVGLHCLIINDNEEVEYDNGTTVFNTNDFKGIDAEDAAQTYINTIEERLGGKLNRETLEVEKPQPEFKDGDVVAVDEIPFDLYSKCIFILKENLNTGEIKARAYVLYNVDKNSIFFDTSVTKVIERNIHLATDEEKQRLFDALAKEGKAWDAKKKMIVDLNSNVDELKPFDKVWVKDNPYGSWEPALFWKKVDAIDLHPYMVIGGKRYRFCEPYEGNEHLLGTTKDVEG